MTNLFRILVKDHENPTAWARQRKRYEAHLRRIKPKIGLADFWRFFASDFFHEGEFSATFSTQTATVHVEASSPNIRCKEGDSEWRFVNLDFACDFGRVLEVSHTHERRADEVRPRWSSLVDVELSRPMAYDYAEIDIVDARRLRLSRRPEYLYCLALRTTGGHAMRLCFLDLQVTCEEPAMFDLMLHSPDYDVPLAEW